MAETKRTGIIDKEGGNILANVVESTATPGTYGLVALNPDGSDIGGPASAIVIGNPVVGGNPGRILYIDQSGNLFGDDAAVRDSGVQKQTTIGSLTYAQGEANDGVSAEVYFQADNIGDTGNSISLVFDGVDDADTVLNAWNTANPGNTASIVDGLGTTVPTAGTRPFIGGGEIIYESGTVNNGISTFFQGSGSTLLDTTNGKIGFSTTGNLISVIQEPSLGFVAAGIDFNTGNLGAMVVSDSGINFFVTDQSTYNARLQGDDVEIILVYNGTYLGVNGLSGPLWGDSSSNRYILPTNVTPSVGDTLAVAGISGNDYALDFVAGGGTPAGADTEIQYNNSGAFGASSDFVFDNTKKTFKVMSSANNLLLVDAATGDYGLGDLDGIGNSTRLFIDDTGSVASIAAGGDRIRLDLDGTAFTGKLGDTGAVGNSTILVVDDATANKKVTSSGTVITVGALNSTNAPTSDPITISGTFTGNATTTYTITVAGSAVDFNWSDGTNSGTNVPMDFGNPTLLSNGISVTFDGFTYTPTEYWTQTYTASVVQRLSLDYKNDIYQMGNLAGSGVRGRLYIDGTNGIASLRSFDSGLGITSSIQTNQTGLSFSSADVNNSSSLTGSANQTRLATTNTSTFDTGNLFTTNNSARLYFQNGGSSSYWGVKATDGVVKVGDFDLLGNSTLLTLDDTNSKITVNNRFEQDKGANVTAANNLTLGGDGNLFVITGNTQINAITTANRQAGSMITLIFTGTPTVKHNTAGGAGTARLFLAGSLDLVAANNTVLGLIRDGTQRQETFRKVA